MILMTPELKIWREAEIRRIMLRRQYFRAWASRRTDICALTFMLCRVEEAEERCSKLMPEWMQPAVRSGGEHI